MIICFIESHRRHSHPIVAGVLLNNNFWSIMKFVGNKGCQLLVLYEVEKTLILLIMSIIFLVVSRSTFVKSLSFFYVHFQQFQRIVHTIRMRSFVAMRGIDTGSNQAML